MHTAQPSLPLAHRHDWMPRRPYSVLASIVVVLGIAVAGWWLFLRPDDATLSHPNHIVATYRKQLPALAAEVQKHPKDSQARQEYAFALYTTGDLEKAKDQYEAQARLLPQDSTVQNDLGNVYRDLGDYDKAATAYQQAVEIYHRNRTAYINLANLYIYTLDEKAKGIQTYQYALQSLPDNQGILLLLGMAYEKVNDKASARATFQKVLALKPGDKSAIAGLQRVQ